MDMRERNKQLKGKDTGSKAMRMGEMRHSAHGSKLRLREKKDAGKSPELLKLQLLFPNSAIMESSRMTEMQTDCVISSDLFCFLRAYKIR